VIDGITNSSTRPRRLMCAGGRIYPKFPASSRSSATKDRVGEVGHSQPNIHKLTRPDEL